MQRSCFKLMSQLYAAIQERSKYSKASAILAKEKQVLVEQLMFLPSGAKLSKLWYCNAALVKQDTGSFVPSMTCPLLDEAFLPPRWAIVSMPPRVCISRGWGTCPCGSALRPELRYLEAVIRLPGSKLCMPSLAPTSYTAPVLVQTFVSPPGSLPLYDPERHTLWYVAAGISMKEEI